MKRANILNLILEMIVIIGNIVLGVTIFVCLGLDLTIDKNVVGVLVLANGFIEVIDFIALKYAIKRKSFQNLVAACLQIILGLVLLIFNFTTEQMCVIWGICSIAFSLAKISSSILTLGQQPLINIVKMLLCSGEILFSVFLIIKTVDSLDTHLLFLGISFSIEALTLLIEFIIHRYHR